MWFLAKFGGIAVLVWFYLTARDKSQSGVKWSIIGLVGYWLTWWLVNLTIVQVSLGIVPKSATTLFLVNQIPAVAAIIAAVLIRKKLMADADKGLPAASEAESEAK